MWPPPGLMDRIYRHQRHIYDATRKFYLLGRDHLIEVLDPPSGGTVLEVGCGTGRNIIHAARRYPQATFHGLDISAEMLATAAGNLEKAGLSRRVRLARDDAAAFDPQELFGRAMFDRVFFSYSLSMIPEWRLALARVAGCLAPGGRLLVVDFGQQEGLPSMFREGLHAWLRRFHVKPRSDLGDVLALIAAERRRQLQFVPMYGGYAVFGEVR